MNSKILIVDDDPLGIDTLQSILEGQGYDIASANNGRTALQKADELLPDLILLDVMMPGMDGFEVCSRIRATPKLAEVPIIILTALDDRPSRLRGIESGADDFLTKPVDRQELRLRVNTVLRLNRYRTLLTQREYLRQMAERVVTAQEEERKRLSRELHDDLGQGLIAHALSLRNLQSELTAQSDLLNTRLATLIADTNQIIHRMHTLAHNIRPTLLDTLGLRSALETHCREFSFRTGLPVIFEADLKLPEMPDLYSITLYRILQETLTNVIKHAHAKQVWVELSIEEHNIALTIQDNGIGIAINEDEPRNGIGITSLRERLTLVGGELVISSSATKGTIISARLPIEESQPIVEKV
jgi:signal transduction histidine kinase